MTHEKRFDVQFIDGRLFAPHSWGSPSMTTAVDRLCFKKDDKEKLKLANMKLKWIKKPVSVVFKDSF